MTGFERQYVDWRLKPQRVAFKWVLSGVGCFFIVMAVGLPIAFSHDSTLDDPTKAPAISMLFIFVLIVFVLGIWFIKIAWSRKMVLNEKASSIAGVLKRQTTTIVNPKSGAASTVTRYMVGDFLILFPIDCETMLTPYEDQPVELTAAMFSVSNPLSLFGGKSILDEPATTALVLEFYDKINIHRAVEKYGLGFFKKRFYLEATAPFAVAILFGAFIYALPDMKPRQTGIWIVAGVFIVVLLFGLFMFLYEKIATSLGFMKNHIPYLEKLKG